MVITVFRSRAREDLDPKLFPEIGRRSARMLELARTMPGFISYKEYRAADGETVALIEFDTHDHVRAWGEHPEHREVQQWGRENVFREYRIEICDAARSIHFP